MRRSADVWWNHVSRLTWPSGYRLLLVRKAPTASSCATGMLSRIHVTQFSGWRNPDSQPINVTFSCPRTAVLWSMDTNV